MIRYSKLTDEQKINLQAEYLGAIAMSTDVLHAVAIAASNALGHNGSVRGADLQADRFSVALTHLVFTGVIELPKIK
jgi:hypothetical protein